MSPQKKMKFALNDDKTVECLQMIEKNDCNGLAARINAESVNQWIYSDGTEFSKTRLIFQAIKQDKIDCVRLLLRGGVDVNLGDCEDESCSREYISSSPLHFCIERNGPLEIMCVLLNQNDCIVSDSHIKSAILADNPTALQILLESDQISQSKTPIINVKDIIKFYADHSQAPILNTLKILSKFVDFASVGRGDREETHRTINGRPTLTYFAEVRTNCSLEEATAIIKFCVKLKCNINSKLAKDVPLHQANDNGSRNFVKALVKCKANVNRLNSRGVTLLYDALQKNDDDLFEFLLKHGADSSTPNANYYGESVLQCVIRNKMFNRMCQIIEHDKNLVLSGSKHHKVPVLHAMLESFINYGIHVNSNTENPMKIVDACISRGVNVNSRCNVEQVISNLSFKGHTVLHLAIRFFSADLCEKLIDLGADLNQLTDFNQCMYSLAMDFSYVFNRDVDKYVNQEDESIKKFLLLEKNGVDLKQNLPMPLNYNIMSYSDCRFTCPSLVESPAATPLRILLSSNLPRLAERLFHLITTPESLYVRDVCLALRTGNFPLSYQVLINVQKEYHYYTSIHLADLAPLFKGSILMRYLNQTNNRRFDTPLLQFSPDSPETLTLSTLSQRGFNINSVDECENNIFHYACMSKRFLDEESAENFVRLIITLGGKKSLDCVNTELQSPLHFALSMKESHFVKILLHHDADFRRKTKLGFSAIHIAVNSGAVSSIGHLVQKSLPKNDLINSWRRLKNVKLRDDINYIEEVDWPEDSPHKYYIVTPLTVAILKKDKEMIKLLIEKYGALLGKKDVHNSIVFNNMTDFSIANFLFEYFPKSNSLKGDSLDNKEPTLEYMFHRLCSTAYWRTLDYTELLNFIMNYVSREYDINEKHEMYMPVLFSLTKLAFTSKSNSSSSGIVQIFNYLMDYSDWKFTTVFDAEGSLLTSLLRGMPCENAHCCFDTNFDSDRCTRKVKKSHFTRNYIIRLFLQRCPSTRWASCRFENYVYHKEDYSILEAILMTPGRGNLIRQWPSIKICPSVKCDDNFLANFISKENLATKIEVPQRSFPTLAELSVMAIKNFSDVRMGYMSLDFPSRTKELIDLLDVENDGDLSWKIFTLDQ